MNIKHLDHLNLTVANLNETIEWYRAVFGFEVVETGNRNGTPWPSSAQVKRCSASTRSTRTEPSRYLVDDGPVLHLSLRSDRSGGLGRHRTSSLELEFGGEGAYPHSTSWYVTDQQATASKSPSGTTTKFVSMDRKSKRRAGVPSGMPPKRRPKAWHSDQKILISSMSKVS